MKENTIRKLLIAWFIFEIEVAVFYFGADYLLKTSEQVGVSILVLYFVLPVTSLVCSFVAGNVANLLKWLTFVLFWLLSTLIPFEIFGKTDLLLTWLVVAIPSFAGLICGHLILKEGAKE